MMDKHTFSQICLQSSGKSAIGVFYWYLDKIVNVQINQSFWKEYTVSTHGLRYCMYLYATSVLVHHVWHCFKCDAQVTCHHFIMSNLIITLLKWFDMWPYFLDLYKSWKTGLYRGTKFSFNFRQLNRGYAICPFHITHVYFLCIHNHNRYNETITSILYE